MASPSPASAALAACVHRLGRLTDRVPSQCEVCRQWADSALCATCIARFAAPRPRCQRCGAGIGMAAPACGDCLRDPPPFAATLCVADYQFPWQRLIAAFKFQQRPELAGVLADRLVDAIRRAQEPRADFVVPVPLSPARLAERGYNQAWELASRVARRLRLRADATLLQRHLDTAHQADLTRAERQRNLRTAFMVDARRRADLHGRHVALVDDVMTTGATAREAAGVLLRAGAARVDVWVVARTPA